MNRTKISATELTELKSRLPDWQIVEQDSVKKLKRSFRFDDFDQALDFTNQVGAIAEAENHHPKLETEWGKVTVTWWTHEVDGLQRKDFDMAKNTDSQYASA